jgi:tripartite ATP-independent transporter DctP family solute receptor
MNVIGKSITRILASSAMCAMTAVALVSPNVSAQTAAPGQFPKMTIKLGTVAAGAPFYHLGTIKFVELVKERTGGAVTIQYLPGSQLGNEKELVELVRNGVIEMTTTGTPMLAVFPGWEPIGVMSMPYVWKGDTDEVRLANMLKVARGPIGKEIADKGVKTSGIRALDLAWWAGLQNLVTKSKEVTKVDEIKGMKIRTPDTPIYRAALAAMGAAVTPMAATEVYTAIQLGVVDGMANTPDLLVSMKMQEVNKYLALTGHLAQIQTLVINDKFYQSLSTDLRAIFEKSAIDAGNYQNDLALKGNKEALEKIKAAGVKVDTVNIAEFADKTKNAWKEFEPQFGKGLYERVVAAQQ